MTVQQAADIEPMRTENPPGSERPFVSGQVFDDVADLRRQYEEAKPFRHVVIDNFFNVNALAELLSEFPSSEKPNTGDYGGAGKKQGTTGVRDFGPNFEQWDRYIAGEHFRSLMEGITGIEGLIYDPDYIGAGVHENFEGYRSQIHIDYNYHPKTNLHRRFNLIVYVTEDWDPSYGGGLVLCENGYMPDESHVERVPCVFNRAIIFETTEHSWHGVESIAFPEGLPPKTRRSITVYMYTKDRPEEETAEFHETIYLPGPMPAQIQKGVEIDEPILQEIQLFVDDARGLIKGLYAHHQMLLKRLRNQLSVVKSYERNYHLPVLGALDVMFARSQSDPAGWIGKNFTAQLTPFPTAKTLTIRMVKHQILQDGFDLKITFGDQEAQIEHHQNTLTAALDLTNPDDQSLQIALTSDQDLTNRPRLLRLDVIQFA